MGRPLACAAFPPTAAASNALGFNIHLCDGDRCRPAPGPVATSGLGLMKVPARGRAWPLLLYLEFLRSVATATLVSIPNRCADIDIAFGVPRHSSIGFATTFFCFVFGRDIMHADVA